MSEPFVVTVIPTFQEVDYIERCLNSIINQTWDSSRHLIHVVDGGSTDGTRALIEKIAESSRESGGPQVLLIDNPERHVSQARNLSLAQLPEEATHLFEMIGHVWLPADHLERRMADFLEIESQVSRRDGKLGGVGTLVKESDEKLSMVARWIEAALQNPLATGRGQFAQFSGREKTLIPPFTIYNVAAVQESGGWNDKFITTQDSELNMRLVESGWQLWRSDASYCRMAKRKTMGGWLRFAHRYGFWRTKHLLKTPKRASLLEFLPLLGLFLTALLFATEFSVLNYPAWIIPPTTYFVVLSLHGLLEAITRKQASLTFGLPLLLFLLHTTFTIGLVDGLFRKGRAPRDRV